MRYRNNKAGVCAGLTLLEMVIALAIMAIIIAVIVPQFGVIRGSWDSKAGIAETIQNGRVLIDHLNRNLSKAVRITAVSDSAVTSGYIEFEDNDGNNARYDVNGTGSYVEFGLVGDLSDLAGPVSQLQFTCYDACDFNTPITDVESIRFVKVQTTLTNSAPLGQDKTFTAWAYLRANGNNPPVITKETPFEYDIATGLEPALAQVDANHYLCAYTGNLSDGWATVLTVNTGTWAITQETPFEFDTSDGETPALAKIDDSHYLCAYSGYGNDGWAVVLTVDTGTWDITAETPFEYETTQADTPALAKIDDSHYLCAYADSFSDGQAVVLTVDTGTWTITAGTPFEYDTLMGATPALAQIDGTHYLCAYTGSLSDGWAVVLTVDTGTWTITAGTPFEYDTLMGATPALAQIDGTHYLCAYTGGGNDGWAVVLAVDTGAWDITKGTPFEYDAITGLTPALDWIDGNRYLCIYEGPSVDGYANILTVDTTNWTITAGTALEYAPTDGAQPAVWKVDDNHYLCGYSGPGNDGWAVVLKQYTELRP